MGKRERKRNKEKDKDEGRDHTKKARVEDEEHEDSTVTNTETPHPSSSTTSPTPPSSSSSVSEDVAGVQESDSQRATRLVFQNAKAGIELKQVNNRGDKQGSVPKIKTVDIQHLILWVLANGENPNWVFVKNKPLIPKVVVVFISGLGFDVYTERKHLMPHITGFSTFSICTCAPGDKKAIFPPLNVFYSCIKSKSQRKNARPNDKNKTNNNTNNIPNNTTTTTNTENITSSDTTKTTESDNGLPPQSNKSLLEDLILSSDDLADNNFPLPDRLVVAETALPHTSEAHEQKVQMATTSTTTTSSSNDSLQIPKSRSVCIPSHGKWARASSSNFAEKPALVAMDCEMCLTMEGLELTRVSVINEKLETIYDSFVLPYNKILDYNTQYSGITAELLKDVTKRLEDVQSELLEIISDKTIIAGHSLENDLIALKLVHTRIIDTSVLYPSARGRGFKNALRWLCRKYLQRSIQTDTHNSIEDSVAVMQLVQHKLAHPNAGDNSTEDSDNLFDVLHSQSRRGILIDQHRLIQSHASSVANCVPVDSDEKCTHNAVQAVKRTDPNAPNLVIAHLHSLNQFLHESHRDGPNKAIDQERLDNQIKALDQNVNQIYDALLPNTLFIVTSPHGDLSYFNKLRNLCNDNPLAATVDELTSANTAARQAISFFTIK